MKHAARARQSLPDPDLPTPHSTAPTSPPHVWLTLLYAAACGGLAMLLHIPLPWMAGPMVGVAAAKMFRKPVAPTRYGRQVGQLIIGAAIGLYFTPVALHTMREVAGWMLLCSFATLGTAALSALWIQRSTGMSFATGFFASVPGGASEMAQLGERHGATVDFVALSQSLRMIAIVVLLPPLFVLSGMHGIEETSASPVPLSWRGLAELLALCAASGGVLTLLRAPTPFMLGPLITSVALTATGHALSAVPAPLTGAAQLFIGLALGCRMERDFLIAAPRLLLASAAAIAINLVLSASIAIGVGAATGIAVPTLLLALAPGGVAEMSLTARLLHLSVPTVSAFHVTRLLVILTLTAPVAALGKRMHARVQRRRND